jgi:transposase
MRRVIGIDTHRTFGEVVIWEDGRLRHVGRVDMTRTALEGFGKKLLATDEVVIEATGNCMAVSRVLTPFVKRVVIANPLQVKAIAHAHVKTDKVDAGTLASLSMRPAIYPRSGRRMRQPSGVAGWWRGATRWSAIARGSRMRCIQSSTPI